MGRRGALRGPLAQGLVLLGLASSSLAQQPSSVPTSGPTAEPTPAPSYEPTRHPASVAPTSAISISFPSYENKSLTYGTYLYSYYPFSWDDVYSLNRKMPQGCSCKNSRASDSSCTEFECDCICDLTAGLCDFNCCCDPDCSAAEVSRFRDSEEGCDVEGPTEGIIEMCYEAHAVNEKYPMAYTGSAERTADKLLCVAYDNSDIRGVFFEDPGDYEGSASVFDEPKGSKPYAYEDFLPAGSVVRRDEMSYHRGDFMTARRISSESRAFGGAVSIPRPGPDGTCMETSYGQFMEAVRDNECLRVGTSLEDVCGSDVNATRFVDLSFCSAYETYSSCSSWVDVEVNSVLVYTTINNTRLTDVLPELSLDELLGTCDNALLSVAYTVYVDSSGAISKVYADLEVGPIAASSSEDPVSVSQTFTMEFASTTSPAAGFAPSAYGSSIVRSKSGNPGYLDGLPLLWGEEAESGSDSAINAWIPGLEVYGSATSATCDSSLPQQTVNFGEDMVSGCVLSVSRDEFSDMCSQTGKYMTTAGPFQTVGADDDIDFSPSVPIFLALNGSNFYVGQFGNADPLDTSQWLQVRVVSVTSTPSLSNDGLLCSDLITSMHLRFLVGLVGEKGNPQKKIVGAELEYTIEDVYFAADDTSVQNMVLTTTVSFVNLPKATAKISTPPPPPILFSVPDDVFYPFHINAAPSRGGAWLPFTCLLSIATSLALVGRAQR